MWTSTYKLRPVTRCKEGCRRQPPGHPGGFLMCTGQADLADRRRADKLSGNFPITKQES
jgi:hypothetical protein